MKTVLYKSEDRGHANHGWLDAHHTFSFASWHNPERVHFGLLRVLNDDKIAAGMGFGRHPHDNMEIVTIPLTGALKHSDSTGGEGVIRAGEVQIMSAGSGVYHSEVNASHSEEVTLFQVWVFPKERNIKPRYDQRDFGKEVAQNKLRTVVSPDAADDALWINQDAFFSIGKFETAQQFDYTLKRKGNGAFVMVVDGSAEVAGTSLRKRDAVGISETDSISISVSANSQLLVIEVPMN